MPLRAASPSAVATIAAKTTPSTTSSKRSSTPPHRQPQQQHMCGHASWRQLLPLHLLLLSIATRSALGNPVSSPEIGNKASGKTSATSLSSSLKSNPQDAQLNSLSAYATNYDSISTASAQANFKPSYRVPEMETNFTPIQTISSPAMASPTPVLMQYLPQPLQEGGVQYLQLIPTRPLIVPIGPYLTGGAAAAPIQSAFHPPLAAAANGNNNNGIAEYAARAPAMLTALPANMNGAHAAAAPGTTLVDLTGAPPYGLPTYANAMQHPYRSSYRINREIKSKHFPGTLSLNMNEYIPASQDGQQQQLSFIRGRP